MYKSHLQELCHEKFWCLPKYSVIKDGPDHDSRFSASVTVNGLSFHTINSYRYSKEAQNEAAKIAFNHYSSFPSSSASFSMPDDSSTVKAPHQPKYVEIPHNSQFHGNGEDAKKDVEAGELQFVYKNQLQIFTQRRSLDLPQYASVHEGPPHAIRFKATVTVDGHTFESPEFTRTLRQAEHAAAKSALMLLSQGVQEDESGFYKNLLLELCQKEGLGLPLYKTSMSGPLHMPVFCSTVELEGKFYSGAAAKTKKQAEMSAAKTAWLELKQGGLTSKKEISSQTSSVLLSSTTIDLQNNLLFQANSASTTKKAPQDDHVKKNTGGLTSKKETSTQTSSVLLSSTTIDLQDNLLLQANSASTTKKAPQDDYVKNTDDDEDAESTTGTSAGNEAHTHYSSTHKLKSSIEKDSSNVKKSSVLQRDLFPADLEESFDNSVTEENTRLFSGNSSSFQCTRIQVYPRKGDLKFPPGATALPIDNDKWIGFSLESPKPEASE